MQNLNNILPLFCIPTRPSYYVSENLEFRPLCYFSPKLETTRSLKPAATTRRNGEWRVWERARFLLCRNLSKNNVKFPINVGPKQQVLPTLALHFNTNIRAGQVREYLAHFELERENDLTMVFFGHTLSLVQSLLRHPREWGGTWRSVVRRLWPCNHTPSTNDSAGL